MVSNDFQIHGVLANYWAEEGNPLRAFHRHNEIELNLLTQGRMVYSIAGRSVAIPIGALSVFWAGFSHRIIEWQPRGAIWSISIPLAIFLQWPLPQEQFVHRLMHGGVLIETDAAQAAFDEEFMTRWRHDLTPPAATTESVEIVLLEIQARIRRLALSGRASVAPHTEQVGAERIAHMLHYIAVHYAEPISVADIADAASTNPSYAMELFKRSCGSSVMEYVNDQRVAHARRMLLTSDAKVLDIALEAGFGSVSQFHEVFRKVTGQTPRQYARSHTGNGNRGPSRSQ